MRPFVAKDAVCPCWLRCCAALRQMEERVGPRPQNRTWREEYVMMNVRDSELEDPHGFDVDLEIDFYSSGSGSLKHVLEDKVREINHKLNLGWCRDHAEMIVVPSPVMAFMESLNDKTPTFAATAYTLLDVMFASAMLLPHTAVPGVYASLSDDLDVGISRYSSGWHSDYLEALGIGGSFIAIGGAIGFDPTAEMFPDEEGMYTYDPTEDMEGEALVTYDPRFNAVVDADILRIVCRPADALGYHAPIFYPEPEDLDGFPSRDTYFVPENTTVTLERIDEAGEWEVLGLKVRRRLFTVSVTFGC